MGYDIHPLYIGAQLTADPSFLEKLDEALTNDPAIVEEKIDGNWVAVEVSEGEVIGVRSRYDHDKLGVTGWFGKRFPVAEGVYLGEATIGTEAGTSEALASGQVGFYLFDIGIWEGKVVIDDPLEGRVKHVHLIQGIVAGSIDYGGSRPYDYDWIKFPRRCTEPGKFHQFFEDLIAEGAEGVMVKYLNWPTLATRKDRKIKSWIKVKNQVDADYVVVDIAATKKGKKATARLGWRDSKGVVDCFQMGIPDLSEKDIGRVVEVRGFGVGRSGAMRSASFVRWRDDRPPDSVDKPEATLGNRASVWNE